MPNPPSPPPPRPRPPAGPSSPPPPPGPRHDGLYDIPAAALWLNLPERWVRDQVTARAIPHRRIGKHVRFAPEDLEQIKKDAFVPAQVAPRRDEVAAKRRRSAA
jgi:hypothetical protein